MTFWMLSGCALHPILTHQYAAGPMPGALPAPAVLRAAFSASLGTDSPDQPLPFHDELTSLCHFALTVTGAASYALLLAHVRAAKAGGKENPAGASTASHPWSVFCTGLWRWLGIEPHAGAPAAPANAWEFVLCRCELLQLHGPFQLSFLCHLNGPLVTPMVFGGKAGWVGNLLVPADTLSRSASPQPSPSHSAPRRMLQRPRAANLVGHTKTCMAASGIPPI